MFESMVKDLERTARRAGERAAFFTDTQQMTFLQLRERARKTGSAIARQIAPGGMTALMIHPRSLDNLAALYGVLYAGCAYAPIDISLPSGMLALILDRLRPDLILADEEGDRALKKARADWAGLSKEDSWQRKARILSVSEAAASPENPQELARRVEAASPNDPMSVFFTSGSSGIPKGAVQTQGAYRAWTAATIEKYGLDEQVRLANQSPFFYANSIIDIFPPVALGACVYLIPGSALNFPKTLLECLNRNRVSELTMTPSSYVKIADAQVLSPGALPYLRWCIASGESMPEQAMRIWAAAAPGADWWHFYGSTEMFSVAVGRIPGAEFSSDQKSALTADGKSAGTLSSGKPFDQVQVRLLDEADRQVSAGETGEIYVSSPWVSRGYYRDPERTALSWVKDPLQEGSQRTYYRSGDLGYFLPDGELVVVGRKDTQIKHGGYRMELGEVERALGETPGCSGGCVLYQKQTGQIWCFYSGTVTEKELKRSLRAALARYMLPDVYCHLDQMPYTSRMKVDRAVLRSRMEDLSKNVL